MFSFLSGKGNIGPYKYALKSLNTNNERQMREEKVKKEGEGRRHKGEEEKREGEIQERERGTESHPTSQLRFILSTEK